MAAAITDIAFEKIIDGYYWGSYFDFKVIVEMTTGYINASHLCKILEAVGGKVKEFPEWKRNKTSEKLINELASSLGIPRDALEHVPPNLPNEVRGTYVHPRLIPSIAMWIDPKFSLKVAAIIERMAIRKAVAKHKNIIKKQKEDIMQKQDKIDELLGKVDELLNINHQIKDNSDQLLELNRELKQDNVGLKHSVDTLTAKIGIAAEDRVPAATDETREIVAIFRRPGTAEYKVLRRQERTFNAGAKTIAADGYSEKVAAVNPTPNAVNIWNRMRTQMGLLNVGRNSKISRIYGNEFVLRTEGPDLMTADDVAVMLHRCDDEKREISPGA